MLFILGTWYFYLGVLRFAYSSLKNNSDIPQLLFFVVALCGTKFRRLLSDLSHRSYIQLREEIKCCRLPNRRGGWEWSMMGRWHVILCLWRSHCWCRDWLLVDGACGHKEKQFKTQNNLQIFNLKLKLIFKKLTPKQLWTKTWKKTQSLLQICALKLQKSRWNYLSQICYFSVKVETLKVELQIIPVDFFTHCLCNLWQFVCHQGKKVVLPSYSDPCQILDSSLTISLTKRNHQWQHPPVRHITPHTVHASQPPGFAVHLPRWWRHNMAAFLDF